MIRVLLARLQPLGRALMLPIAVLPVAGLLLRLGQPDLLDLAFVAAAGDAIFSNLGLLFAVGVAVGLARENNGAAGLAGAVAFLVATEGAKALLHAPLGSATGDATTSAALSAAWRSREIAKLGVPMGLLAGLAAGGLYNRFGTIKLPDYLAFFGGRRFVPIAAGGAGVGLAALFGLGYPWLAGGIDQLSHWVVGAGDVGLFLYGLLNRLLLITGLHHILNNVVWFIVGDFHGATGDLKRFFAGDPSAGAFMAGFFPVMMFGLPAACLAMYRTAAPGRRQEVGGLLLSLAATSFLTGVTEPIEFTFIFLAPQLFALHAVLTGAAMVIMDVLGVRLGFGFSAGLLDYVLNFNLATRPLLLLPVGGAYAAIYYFAFRYCILRFDLATPGRGGAAVAPVAVFGVDDQAGAYIAALGGPDNLRAVDACTTRLRLDLARLGDVDEAALKRLGARGVVRPGGHALQVVIGPQADSLAALIRAGLANTPQPADQIGSLIEAVGGTSNIERGFVRGARVCLKVVDTALVDRDRLTVLVPRGFSIGPQFLHIVAGPEAGKWTDMLLSMPADPGLPPVYEIKS